MIHSSREAATLSSRPTTLPPGRLAPATEVFPTGPPRHPVSVAVLIDLELRPDAGGHVKCWERFAGAAARHPDRLDLTVHTLGRQHEVITIADNVRFVTHRPFFSTRLFSLTRGAPGHTDLSPVNPAIVKDLKTKDVIHTTDAYFAQARTGLRLARRRGKPLVTSIHTDSPAYTRIFLERLMTAPGKLNAVTRFIFRGLRLPERAERFMLRRLDRYLRRCDWVFVSKSGDLDHIRSIVPGRRASLLRRGIDKAAFHPRHRDRGRLHAVYGIPESKPVLLYVGRVDRTKNVPVLAQAAKLLLDSGEPIHLLVVGGGDEKDALKETLGPDVTLAGRVFMPDLAWVYASSDIFVFPSETEVSPNVVLEAKASGLPVILSSRGGSGQHVSEDGRDGLLVDDGDPQEWANAIRSLTRRPPRLRRMGEAARTWVERDCPGWEDVLLEDLLPVWEAAAATARAGGGRS